MCVEYLLIPSHPKARKENEDKRLRRQFHIHMVLGRSNSYVSLNSERPSLSRMAAPPEHVLDPFCFSSLLIICMTGQKFAEHKPLG